MKKLISIISIALLSLSCTFAKPNPNAKTYKTYETTDKNAPVVYFIRDITGENLVKVYDALGFKATGKIGVKMSTGEPPNSNYLRPELISQLVKKVDGTIVECNTAGGGRGSNAMHKQVAKDHGLDSITAHGFDLLDEEGFMTIPIVGGTWLKEDYVGSHFANYNSYLVLSHFKGHALAGFGGAMKNLSIGFGSGTSVKKSGKAWIHSAGKSATYAWGNRNQDSFTESMAEASKGVCDYMAKKGGMCYINVMNRLSVDCDCNGNPAEPDMHDIGILASLDPVAVDQACIDKVWKAEDSGSLIARVERQNGRHIWNTRRRLVWVLGITGWWK